MGIRKRGVSNVRPPQALNARTGQLRRDPKSGLFASLVAAHVRSAKALARIASVFAVFAGLLGIDIATKAWAAAVLAEPVRISDWLGLILYRNSGMFLGKVPVSAGYWVGVVAAMGWFGWRALRSTSVPVAVCLAAVLAGLTGNALGRTQGAVVDFIAFGPVSGDKWLVVNIADLALVGGALALGLHLIWARARVRCVQRPR